MHVYHFLIKRIKTPAEIIRVHDYYFLIKKIKTPAEEKGVKLVN
jgi:hypothetical protein